ncbi:NADPH-dependent conjugated polyketone reductase C1 [Mycena venus]|uniref:NADPH-dependent conjugated polyketone reductase C1 n=1 Tax=Mycena venus TaxID=2733690 RepID=A0A8H7D8A0_9AGAR|nr:NADPH-dependent conjugated polyketone reductase C1 [Mycena venus]
MDSEPASSPCRLRTLCQKVRYSVWVWHSLSYHGLSSTTMPWETHELDDGYKIPGLAFGTWKLGTGDGPIDQVNQAISVGFSHIDTAQLYRNETEAGIAIRDSEHAREDIFITTKYSRTNGLDIQTSIRNSLKYATGSVEMEEIQSLGMTRSIGVSNFNVEQLEILLTSAKVKPAVNQVGGSMHGLPILFKDLKILLHPYVYAQQLPILEYAAKHQIVTEAYSVLIPITSRPGGPLDAPLLKIADKHGVTMDQVLLAWTKAKGAVVVTYAYSLPQKMKPTQVYLAQAQKSRAWKDTSAQVISYSVKTILRRSTQQAPKDLHHRSQNCGTNGISDIFLFEKF